MSKTIRHDADADQMEAEYAESVAAGHTGGYVTWQLEVEEENARNRWRGRKAGE